MIVVHIVVKFAELTNGNFPWGPSSPKVHLEVGQVLRGGVRPGHAAERVQLWLVQQDLLYLIEIQVALVHLQDLGMETRGYGNFMMSL